jgi:hypothetical protein
LLSQKLRRGEAHHIVGLRHDEALA